jgi:secreted trypsin-like serine protease
MNTSRTVKIAVATAATLTSPLLFGVTAPTAGAIVGGTKTTIATSPWQVSLQAEGAHLCGGSILDATTVVTAAHCVTDGGPLSVRAGVSKHRDRRGQDIDVAEVIAHDGGAEAGTDIAIVRLSRPLQFNAAVQPIALASAAELAAATTARVTGWGAISETGPSSAILRTATLTVIDDRTCERNLRESELSADTETCAQTRGKGSCYGDSGGPLTIIGADGAAKLAGIVSWGEVCGYSPDVYAEVPAFAEWIANPTSSEVDDDVDMDEEWDDEDDWSASESASW